jgi:hypothetical protein
MVSRKDLSALAEIREIKTQYEKTEITSLIKHIEGGNFGSSD